MTNDYSQIALPGCDGRKANLFYDRKEKLWIEHLTSSCETNLDNVLQLCRSVYPSLNVTNVAPLITSLAFKNWCEIVRSNDQTNLPTCEITLYDEETVTPYRCLHEKSFEEETIESSKKNCQKQKIQDLNKCSSINQLKQRASTFCNVRGEVFTNQLRSLISCGLARFNAVEFNCCSLKDSSSSSTNEEDDPIEELVIVPQTKLLAQSRFSQEPEWYENYRQSANNKGLFADDEDLRDERKSQLTMSEHQRFSEAKQKLRENFQEQFNDLKTQWETRLIDIQNLANENSAAAQRDFENADLEFRRQYDRIQQSASLERTRINEEHEKNLDRAIAIAQSQAEENLNRLWNSEDRQIEAIGKAFYHYIHVLLRDRIHLVNRYERLRDVDPEQAQRKRTAIHERLFVIESLIDQAFDQINGDADVQQKTLPQINKLIDEYDEVNEEAKKLLNIYQSTVETTTMRNRRLSDRKHVGSSINSRPLLSMSSTRKSPLLFSKYWIWPIATVTIVLLIIGLCLLRCVIVQRRNHSSHRHQKNYTFTSVETRSVEDENLRALQMNGYENPTYKFFEKRNPQC